MPPAMLAKYREIELIFQAYAPNSGNYCRMRTAYRYTLVSITQFNIASVVFGDGGSDLTFFCIINYSN